MPSSSLLSYRWAVTYFLQTFQEAGWVHQQLNLFLNISASLLHPPWGAPGVSPEPSATCASSRGHPVLLPPFPEATPYGWSHPCRARFPHKATSIPSQLLPTSSEQKIRGTIKHRPLTETEPSGTREIPSQWASLRLWFSCHFKEQIDFKRTL